MAKVNEVMTTKVKFLHPEENLKDVAMKMKEFDVGVFPVVKEDKVTGIVTDRDIVMRAIAEGKDPSNVQVQNVMTTDVTTCYENQDLAEAVDMMKDKQIRRMIVLNKDNDKVAGIFSIGDISNYDIAKGALEEISKPNA